MYYSFKIWTLLALSIQYLVTCLNISVYLYDLMQVYKHMSLFLHIYLSVCACLQGGEKILVCKHVFLFLLMYMRSHVYGTVCLCKSVWACMLSRERWSECVCERERITLPDGHRVRWWCFHKVTGAVLLEQSFSSDWITLHQPATHCSTQQKREIIIVADFWVCLVAIKTKHPLYRNKVKGHIFYNLSLYNGTWRASVGCDREVTLYCTLGITLNSKPLYCHSMIYSAI